MDLRILFSEIAKKIKWLADKIGPYSTLIYSVLTLLVVIVMSINTCKQVEFNNRQLQLYELTTIPQVFIELDSLSLAHEHNVFYKIRNVGNSPALGLRMACLITSNKQNPLKEEITREVTGDVFPGTSVSSRSLQTFKPEGTKYLHFRVDLEDLLRHKYCYKATYFLIFQPSEDAASFFRYKSGYEYSEYNRWDH
jgi:hypothetical protein